MIDRNMTVGEIATAAPQSLNIFKKLNIDFCCGGNRLLAEVLNEKNTTFEQFDKLLQQTQEERKGSQETSFLNMSPAVLTAYIEDTHHDYLRRTLPETAELLATVLRVHGKNHRELFEVYRLFGQLKTDLEQHLIREETMLFPALAQPGIPEHETAALAAEIIGEHEAAGKLLQDLNKVTTDFSVPPDACKSYKKVYAMILEVEEDLHRHIHLENNILLRDFDIRSH
jgi:regulator of cell morphogenesis and NO signaling